MIPEAALKAAEEAAWPYAVQGDETNDAIPHRAHAWIEDDEYEGCYLVSVQFNDDGVGEIFWVQPGLPDGEYYADWEGDWDIDENWTRVERSWITS